MHSEEISRRKPGFCIYLFVFVSSIWSRVGIYLFGMRDLVLAGLGLFVIGMGWDGIGYEMKG